MEYRQHQGGKTPALVVAIDEVEPLLREGRGPIVAPLMRLLQQGAPAGIHVILSTDSPASPSLDNVLKASLPLRLVGRVANADEARAAAGVTESQAEYLQGYGDFIAILGDTMTPFQAAYIGDAACQRTIQRLKQKDKGSLLAYPIDPITGEVVAPVEMASQDVTAAADSIEGEMDLEQLVEYAEDDIDDDDTNQGESPSDEVFLDDGDALEMEDLAAADLEPSIWFEDDDGLEAEEIDLDEEINPVALTEVKLPLPRTTLPQVIESEDYTVARDQLDDPTSVSAPGELDEVVDRGGEDRIAADAADADEDWLEQAELEYEDDEEFLANETVYEDDDEIPFE